MSIEKAIASLHSHENHQIQKFSRNPRRKAQLIAQYIVRVHQIMHAMTHLSSIHIHIFGSSHVSSHISIPEAQAIADDRRNVMAMTFLVFIQMILAMSSLSFIALKALQ